MKLTVLGNNGLYPLPGGACPGYLISHMGTNVLLDCGTGVLAHLLERITLKELHAIVLSHLHFDHVSDILPMTYALAGSGRSEPVPLIAPTEPAPIRELFDARVYSVREPGEMTIGALTLSFRPGRHPVPAYIVSVRSEDARLVYTGDTNTHPVLADFFESADLLLADAGLLEADWAEQKPHLSAARCGKLARAAGVKRLLLTHLSPLCAPEAALEEARGHYPSAELAKLGCQYEL